MSDDKEEPVIMYRCHESGGNQFFEFDKGRIGRDDYYIEYEPPNVMIKGHHHVDNVQVHKCFNKSISNFIHFFILVVEL